MSRDSATLRHLARRLDRKGGGVLWRDLDERSDPPALRAAVEREFPSLAPLLDRASRRDLLKVMGASLALAGLTGCDAPQPEEKALPFVNAPEFGVPGQSVYYASATLHDGYAIPVLVETVEGRPIKVEGNPDHPLARGRIDPFAQAAVLELYDQDRSRTTTHLGDVGTWDRFQDAMVARMRVLEGGGGEGLAILTGTITSPTTKRQMERLQKRLPGLAQFRHEAVDRSPQREATVLAFGRPLDLHPRLDRADLVLAIEADPLGPGPAQIVHARRFAEGRRRALEKGRLPGLHVLECTPSLTGARATRRRPASAAHAERLLVALAQHFGLGPTEALELSLEDRAWLREIAAGLESAGSAGLVLVGFHLPAELQALGLRINQSLGALGHTMELTEPVAWQPEGAGSLADLAGVIRAGRIDTLVMLDTNPVYTAPADLDFEALLEEVPLRVHLGAWHDETAASCHWHVPECHVLESWSDARAVDGTAGVLQPTIRPLHASHTVDELLATLGGEPSLSAYEAVRRTWREILGEGNFETRWVRLLSDGFLAAEPAPVPPPDLRPLEVDAPLAGDGLEVVFRPDPTIRDGRFANNAWLQELPKPLTKLTWENVAAVSPAFAAEADLKNGEMIQIASGGRRIEAPVWVLPGQASRTVTLHMGYGRRRAGSVGSGIGYDAYRLRRTDALWRLDAVGIERANGAAALATTQLHRKMAGHDLVKKTTVEAVREGRPVTSPSPDHSLYPDWPYERESWGMAIDLDTCIGCNACVVACMAENNVPVVGKEQVAMGREMHWLRIDTYYEGSPDNPLTHFQPVPCMHCEQAPCEVGCPVNATVHGPEGLNQMVYNRCVGTRTCASYCPYKVRHFNFYDFAGGEGEGRVPQRNPEVTVRARGVMEKCTYCVQRISRARITAKKEGRAIADGEVVTACQGACPTRAITFGNINDPKSAVSRAKASPRHYALLEELGVRPRTTYLARLMPGEAGDGGSS